MLWTEAIPAEHERAVHIEQHATKAGENIGWDHGPCCRFRPLKASPGSFKRLLAGAIEAQSLERNDQCDKLGQGCENNQTERRRDRGPGGPID